MGFNEREMESIKEVVQKVSEYKWIIPKKNGMHVPGVIYISEKLLTGVISDNVIHQIINVAKLPGIVKYSLAMPDVHWGYGAPIGGVGAFDAESGVIAPGFVGYDINCLPGETNILHEYGYYFPLRNCEKIQRNLICFDEKKKKKDITSPTIFMKKREEKKLFVIKTEAGYKIRTTGDHPIYSLRGKVEAENLKAGDSIVLYPFQGVPFEDPKDETILDKENLKKVAESFNRGTNGNSFIQIVNKLERNGLLPLKYNSLHLPEIIKMAGYLFGDGSISFSKKNKGANTSFFGKFDDMKEVKKDIEKIGFASIIYSRKRKHKIITEYSQYEFKSTTSTCQTASRSLSLFLVSLGVPYGKKTSQDFRVPFWLFHAPLWQKRLFLASFFGAEMSSPKSYAKHGYNFYCPIVSLNKELPFKKSGEGFMRDIAFLLEEFGVETRKISSRIEKVGKDRKPMVRLRLILSTKPKSLINLCQKVGIEYNMKKRFLTNLSAYYLR